MAGCRSCRYDQSTGNLVGETTLTFVRDIDVGAWGDYNIPEARDIPDKIEPDRMAGTTFTIVVKEKT